MSNLTKFSRLFISSSFLFLAIFFHTNNIAAQHPCDDFPVVTCNVPGALETWTVSDNNTSATGQIGEPFYFSGTVQKTLWVAWTAPKTRVYVADTRGTNPNNVLTNDTILRIFKGGNTFASLTLMDESEDWDGTSECQQYLSTLRGTEQLNSSCTILYAVAGTKYYFQIDGDLLPPIGFPNFGAYLFNLRPLIEPTSSNVSINGKVTDNEGRALANVRLNLTKPNGEIVSAVSNSFGNYHFTGIESGQSYILQAQSRRFLFENNPRVLTINENVQNENFVALGANLKGLRQLE